MHIISTNNTTMPTGTFNQNLIFEGNGNEQYL